jgi:hypothetical protein
MATVIRKTDPGAVNYANAVNALKLQIGAGALAHLDVPSDYCSTALLNAACTDLPSLIALLNQLRAVSITHRADTLCHKAADGTSPVAVAADLPTSITLANGLKADHNTHIASTAIHFNADATNSIAAANGTVLADTITLANAIRTAYLGHMGTGMAPTNCAPSIRLISA